MKRRAEGIPVHVVEDHNDALPVIHRLIGSKRLPLVGLVLLHFDAHSDLSAPKNLRADDVRNVHTLYDSLSIENWILPLVYAGHVGSVIWVKPPWTRDSMSPTSQFLVGRDVDTDRISVSSTDNYFLSELSHSLPSNLDSPRHLDLLVRTLDHDAIFPQGHDSDCGPITAKKPRLFEAEMAKIGDDIPNCGIVSDNLEGIEKMDLVCKSAINLPVSSDLDSSAVVTPESASLELAADVTNSISPLQLSSQAVDSAVSTVSFRSSILVSDEIKDLLDRSEGGGAYVLDIDLDFFSTLDPFKGGREEELTEGRLSRGEFMSEGLGGRIYELIKELYQFTPPVDLAPESVFECLSRRREQIEELCAAMKEAKAGHTDVRLGNDLHRNRLLQALIREQKSFASCDDSRNSSVETQSASHSSEHHNDSHSHPGHCSNTTHRGLSEDSLITSSGFHRKDNSFSANHLDANSDCHRKRTVSEDAQRIVGYGSDGNHSCVVRGGHVFADASSCSSKAQEEASGSKFGGSATVDFDWLHEIGTGVDDCPLPHHVSSLREIVRLVASVEAVLRGLPPPTAITIARSSDDDYCPKHQVEFIQESVLRMLQSVYSQLDVHLNYLDVE